MITDSRIGNVQMWWKYRNLWERLIRRKTIYYKIKEEATTVGYQLTKTGMRIVFFEQRMRDGSVRTEPVNPFKRAK
jgi:hypothetical protein